MPIYFLPKDMILKLTTRSYIWSPMSINSLINLFIYISLIFSPIITYMTLFICGQIMDHKYFRLISFSINSRQNVHLFLGREVTDLSSYLYNFILNEIPRCLFQYQFLFFMYYQCYRLVFIHALYARITPQFSQTAKAI